MAPTRSCWARSTSGSMVEQSTTVLPGPRRAASHPRRRRRRVSWGRTGRRPRSPRPPGLRPPRCPQSHGGIDRTLGCERRPSPCDRPRGGAGSWGAPWRPGRRSRAASCPPDGGSCELGQPPGGRGQQLVHHRLGRAAAPAGQRVEREGGGARSRSPRGRPGPPSPGRRRGGGAARRGCRGHGGRPAAHARPVDHADRLDHRAGGEVRAWPALGMLTGNSRVPVSRESMTSAGSSPDGQVWRSLVPASHASTSAM